MFEFRQAKEEELEEVFKLRYKVYCLERNYLDSNDCPNGAEKDIYDNYSVHFLAFDTDKNKIVGTSRLILNSPLGFPIEKEWDLSEAIKSTKDIRNKIVEISRFIIALENRGDHFITLSLGGEMYRYCKRNGIEIVYAIMDLPILKMLIGFGFPFKILSESKFYMGAQTTPSVMLVNEMEEILKKQYPNVYKYFSNDDR